MIEKIKKELEKIPDKINKIKFLTKKLDEIEDKKIEKEVEKLINQLIEEENLEEKVETNQQTIPIPNIPRTELARHDEPRKETERATREPEQQASPQINYTTQPIRDYHTNVQEITTALTRPVERDITSNLNLNRVDIVNPYENTERRHSSREYMTAQEELDIANLKIRDLPQFNPLDNIDITNILKGKKDKPLKPKYEMT